METPFRASSTPSEDRVWEEEEKQGSPIPSRQSFKRTPVPLHHGLGFGAEAIVSQSIKVARKKSVEKEARIKKFLSAPVSRKSATNWPEINSHHDNKVSNILSEDVTIKNSKQNKELSSGVKKYGVQHEEDIHPTVDTPNTLNLRIKGFVSGLTDSVLFSTCLLIALFIKFSYFGENVWGWSQVAGSYLAQLVAFPDPLLLGAGIMVMGIAIILSSTIQMFFGLFLGVSGGQYSMGIRPSGKKNKIVQAISIFLSSFFSLGFILSPLWFLIFPGKLPFIPWYSLENDE